MPQEFSRFGITFLYPENWHLETDEPGDSVSLESPQGAFLSLSRLDDIQPQAAIERVLAAMHQDYENIETEPLAREIETISLRGLTLRFVYLDLIIASQILSLAHGEQTFLIQIQAEDRDLEELEPVFDAILTSLCTNLRKSR